MSSTKQATMKDVASTAGVSQQTVSRVLRTPDAVARATRTRVAEVIAELGYVPNEAAQRLQSARFAQTPVPLSVGVETPGDTTTARDDLPYPQASQILDSLHALARAWGVPNLASTMRGSMSRSLSVVKDQLTAHDLEGPGALLAVHGQLALASRSEPLAHLEEHLRARVECLRPRRPDAYDWVSLVALADELLAAVAGTDT